MFSPLELLHDTVCLEPAALCKLHRNEPGWFVGEHIQDRFGGFDGAEPGLADFTEMDRAVEPDRWLEKLSEWEWEGEE